MATADLPAPPKHPTGGQSCDGGGCTAESIGWCYDRELGLWLPCCSAHMTGWRIYDNDLDGTDPDTPGETHAG